MSIINYLLDCKADINIEINVVKNVKPAKKIDFQEIINRPLFAAITSNSPEIVKAIINKDGINFNMPDSEHGITPMLYALNFMLDTAIQPGATKIELTSILQIVNVLLKKNAYLIGDARTAKQDKAYINLLDKNVCLLAKKIKELEKQRIPIDIFISIENLCEHSMHQYILEGAIRNKDSSEVNEIITSYMKKYGNDHTQIFLDKVFEICKQKYSIDEDILSILKTSNMRP